MVALPTSTRRHAAGLSGNSCGECYQYVLYGMGFRTEVEPEMLAGDAGIAERAMRENLLQTERLRAGLPRHRDLIRKIREHGLNPL